MTTVIPSGYGLVTFEYNWQATSSNVCVTTLGVDTDGSPALTLEAVEDAWLATDSLGTPSLLYTGGFYRGATIRYPVGGGDYAVAESRSNAQAGGKSGSPALPQVSMIVQKRSALVGRRNRGRMFIPNQIGPADGDADRYGTWIAAGSVWQDKADEFLSLLTTAGITPVLLHSDGATPTTITEFRTNQTVGLVRSRLR